MASKKKEDYQQTSFSDLSPEKIAEYDEKMLVQEALKLLEQYKELSITRLQRELRVPYGKALRVFRELEKNK